MVPKWTFCICAFKNYNFVPQWWTLGPFCIAKDYAQSRTKVLITVGVTPCSGARAALARRRVWAGFRRAERRSSLQLVPHRALARALLWRVGVFELVFFKQNEGPHYSWCHTVCSGARAAVARRRVWVGFLRAERRSSLQLVSHRALVRALLWRVGVFELVFFEQNEGPHYSWCRTVLWLSKK